jgi:hypothetical protein
MIDTLKITAGAASGGKVGGSDTSGHFSVYAQTSAFSTIEINRELENALIKIYQLYLEKIAELNNGRY